MTINFCTAHERLFRHATVATLIVTCLAAEHTSAQPPPYMGPQGPTTAYPGTTALPPPQYQYGGDQQQPYGGNQGQYGYQQYQQPPPDLGMPQAAIVSCD